MLPEFDIEDTFKVFLEKSRKHMLILYAFNIEEFIMEKYLPKGFTREQVFAMPLKDLWSLIENYKSKRRHGFWINKNDDVKKFNAKKTVFW